MYFPSDLWGDPTGYSDDLTSGFTGGMLFTVSENTVVTGMRVYATSQMVSAGVQCYGNLFIGNPTGEGEWTAPVATASAVVLALGWNNLPFSSSYTLVPSTTYRVAARQEGSAKYAYKAETWPVSDSPFTASTAGFAYDFWNQPLEPSTNWYGVDIVTDAPPALSVVATHSPASVEAGSVVTLSATPSNATGGVTYSWAQTTGPTVTLSSTTAQSPTFTPNAATTYAFTVTATDTVTSATSSPTSIVVRHPAPPSGTVWVQADDSKWYAAGRAEPWVFHVEDYGAVGDGVADDTAAIRATLSAAIEAAPQNGYIAEVHFQAKTYLLSSACVKGGDTAGNAQIPLPPIRSGDQKVTVRFQGVRNGAPYSHWNQSPPMLTGTVLLSSLTGQAWDPTYGFPAIIGGPGDSWVDPDRTAGGINVPSFSNMLVYTDGITFSAPANPTVACLGLKNVAAAYVGQIACIANAKAVGSPSLKTSPTNESYGVVLPGAGNNVRSQIEALTVEGFGTALVASEHATVADLGAVYCTTGLYVSIHPAGLTHGVHVQHACFEAVGTYIDTNGGGSVPLVVGLIDGEGTIDPTVHVNDPTNALCGTVDIFDIFQPSLTVHGASHMTVTNLLPA